MEAEAFKVHVFWQLQGSKMSHIKEWSLRSAMISVKHVWVKNSLCCAHSCGGTFLAISQNAKIPCFILQFQPDFAHLNDYKSLKSEGIHDLKVSVGSLDSGASA